MDAELLQLLEEKKHRDEGRRFYRTFPEEGKFSRWAYPKQLEFFALGKEKRFRCLLGGNGTGKSVSGAFETTCHLTGRYPDWWEGKRFTRAINAWAAGVDFKTLRESLQNTLLGPRGKEGTGMIPRDLLVTYKYRSSPPDTLDYIEVKHFSGGTSRLVLKSYEEGRESFQAANVDFIWLDEEAPWDIYSECVQRFRGDTALGQLILTFTPLLGVSDVICMFVPAFMNGYDEDEYQRSSRAYVNCTMDDVPHVAPEDKALKLANTLPHEREARINGQPSVGEGRVYPFAEDSFVIDPIPGGLPRHWPRLYGMDPGRVVTAAVWLAHDTDTDTVYVYSEHYGEDQLPPVHAQAIKMRGHWIPGVCDRAASANNALQDDSLLMVYTDPKWKLGLRLKTSEGGKGSVAEGIFEVYTRLATGRLKVYKTCTKLLGEFRQYSRDKQNRIVKRKDHALDAMRYGVMGLRYAMLPHDDELSNRTPKIAEQTFELYG